MATRKTKSESVNPYSNVQVEIDNDGVMRVTMQTRDVAASPSKSGKSLNLATTGGALSIPNPDGGVLKLNLTLYTPL